MDRKVSTTLTCKLAVLCQQLLDGARLVRPQGAEVMVTLFKPTCSSVAKTMRGAICVTGFRSFPPCKGRRAEGMAHAGTDLEEVPLREGRQSAQGSAFDVVAPEAPPELPSERVMAEWLNALPEARAVFVPAFIMLLLLLLLLVINAVPASAAWLLVPSLSGICASTMHHSLYTRFSASLSRIARLRFLHAEICLTSVALASNVGSCAGFAVFAERHGSPWIILPLFIWLAAFTTCCAFFLARLRTCRCKF